jgi:hypothetical protein
MKVLEPDSVARLGSFLLHRSGNQAQVNAIRPDDREDPNRRLLREAAGRRPALVWFYNLDERSVARTHPPRIMQLAPDWACSEEGGRRVRILVCAPRSLSED